MKQILKTIIGLAIVQSAFGTAPKMFWADDCPDVCKKCLEVEFKYGEKDTACLSQMYDDNTCLFSGNFMEKATRFGQVVVSSSQCLKNGGMDDVQVSFMDDRSPGMAMFKANTKIGTCSAEFNTYGPNEVVMEMDFPQIDNSSFQYRMKDISMRQTPGFPTNGFTLNLALRYDNNFANHFGGASENTVKTIMAHSQNHFAWDSLDANMCLKIQSIKQYNGNIDGDKDLNAQFQLLKNHIVSNEQEDPNLFVYISYYDPKPGTFSAGIASVGTVCWKNFWNSNTGKGPRSSISLWTKGDLETAEIVSHEIGHNLGMQHDFNDELGVNSNRFCETNPSKNCVNTGGVMDYFQTEVVQWSCCSNSDFLKMYQQQHFQPFCLVASAATCDGTSPTVAPTQPPIVPVGCAVPSYFNDGWCDDINNNEGCNNDGGDCCPPHNKPNWNEYCQECKCKGETVICGGHQASSCAECPGENGAAWCNGQCQWLNGECVPEGQPPTNPPTLPGVCGEPNFIGDNFCDDSNNNAGCNYDNGDCCQPHQIVNWNEFCQECECKDNGDSPTRPPTTSPCEDDASEKYCKKINKKKCKKSKFYKKCRKTCDKCGPEPPEDCKDAKPLKFCKKNKKKCNKKKIAKKCKKTCEAC